MSDKPLIAVACIAIFLAGYVYLREKFNPTPAPALTVQADAVPARIVPERPDPRIAAAEKAYAIARAIRSNNDALTEMARMFVSVKKLPGMEKSAARLQDRIVNLMVTNTFLWNDYERTKLTAAEKYNLADPPRVTDAKDLF